MEGTVHFVSFCVVVLSSLLGSFAQNINGTTNSTEEPDNGMIVSLFPGFYQGHLQIFQGDVKNLATNGNPPNSRHGFSNQNVRITTFASDPVVGNLHFIEVETNSLYRIDYFTIDVNHSKVSVALVHQGLSRAICKMAYDYITGIIYWTDPLYHRISLRPTFDKDLTNTHVLVNQNLDYPVAIAIDPEDRLLFWSNSPSSGTVIESSYLDGSNRSAIVTSTLVYVDDMVADVKAKTLYWLDNFRKTIEKCDYNGGGRKNVRRIIGYDFTSLTHVDDLLCVASHDSQIFACLYKASGATLFVKQTTPSNPYGLHIYDKRNYVTATDFCKTTNCSDICVNGQSSATCKCRDGYSSTDGGKTCIAINKLHPRAILVVNATNICTIDLAVITGNAVVPLCIAGDTDNATLIEYSRSLNILFFYDQPKKQIWMYLLSTDTKQKVSDVGDIDDMSYDWVNGVMYTISSSAKEIVAYSMKNFPQVEFTVVYSNIEMATELVVEPHTFSIFWIAKDGIYKGSYSQQTPKLFVNKEQTSKASGLFYDYHYDELFWMDEAKGTLYSGTYDGKTIQPWQFTTSAKHLAVYKDYAIWTNGKGHLYSALYAVANDPNKHDINVFGTITGMTVMDDALQQQYPSPCSMAAGYGGCEQLCFPVDKQNAVCKCDFGYTLEANGKNCTTTPLLANFLLTTDLSHDRIYQIPMDGSSVITLDIADAFVPAMVKYEPKSGRIYWSDVGSKKLKSAKLNGDSSLTVFSTGEGFPDRFVFDYYTGLMYFTVTESSDVKTSYIAVMNPTSGKEQYKILITALDHPSGIAIYPAKGYLFFNNHNTNDKYIGRSNMDGTHFKRIIINNLGTPLGMAIDYSSDKLYWTDAAKDVIEMSSLNGADRQILNQAYYPLGDPVDLSFSGGFLYIVGYNLHSIKKFDISNNTKVPFMNEYAEFGPMDSVDIFPSTNIQLAHSGCITNNGGCKYYCLPTETGAVCGCPIGLEPSGAGLKNCAKASQICSADIQNGYLETGCTAKKNEQCSYKCNAGYSKNTLHSTITCSENLEWNVPTAQLCIPIQSCPLTIKNGNFPSDCTGQKKEDCMYSCNKGFTKNTQYPTVKCNENLQWNAPTDKLCITIQSCPLTIKNGNFPSDCTGQKKEDCMYSCNKGFTKNTQYPTVKCNENLQWNAPTDKLCIIETSPWTKSYYTTTMDARTESVKPTVNYSESPVVTYHVTTSQRDHRSNTTEIPSFISSIRNDIFTWPVNNNPFKSQNVEIKCPLDKIDNGHISVGCQGRLKDTCSYSCNTNYEPVDPTKDSITCSDTGKWSLDTTKLCIKQTFCPSKIPNGALTSNCQRSRGSICGYTCNQGFTRSSSTIVALTCRNDHTWDYDLTKLCSGTPTVSGRKSSTEDSSNPAVIGLAVVIVLLIIIIVCAVAFFLLRRKVLLHGGKQQQAVYRSHPNVYFNSSDLNGQGSVTGFTNPVAQVNGDTLPNTNPLKPEHVVITTQAEAAALPEKQNMENMAASQNSGGVYETIKADTGVQNPLYSELHASEEIPYKNVFSEEEQQPVKPGFDYQRFK